MNKNSKMPKTEKPPGSHPVNGRLHRPSHGQGGNFSFRTECESVILSFAIKKGGL